MQYGVSFDIQYLHSILFLLTSKASKFGASCKSRLSYWILKTLLDIIGVQKRANFNLGLNFDYFPGGIR